MFAVHHLEKWVFRILFFLPAAGIHAQPFEMNGSIRCYQTRQQIPANISFEKQPNADLTFVSKSSTEGYSVRIARPGIYMLKASLPGYLPEFHELNLDHDSMKGKDKYQYDFFLIPITIDQILPFRNILFEPSSSQIGANARPELMRLADVLSENPAIIIRLEGHTDNVSKSRSSLNLAKRRIKSVKNFLVSRGIDPGRIELKAFGGGNPLFRHGTPEAHQANRRVEVRVIAL